MSKLWICFLDGKECGPFTSEKVRLMVENGQIGPADLLRRQGQSTWKKARELPGLIREQPPQELPPRRKRKQTPPKKRFL
ncbi:MAG: DUF4339 domain-containing protein [Planctomycetaceae bacterium]|nr:DUF4339 domain-containing protein [Planctomycetaceae bacterium]